jgi:hypothetical protein
MVYRLSCKCLVFSEMLRDTTLCRRSELSVSVHVISVCGVEFAAFASERRAEFVFCYWLFKRILALRLPVLDIPVSNLIPKFLMVFLRLHCECIK